MRSSGNCFLSARAKFAAFTAVFRAFSLTRPAAKVGRVFAG
jgi:hypothetical protein